MNEIIITLIIFVIFVAFTLVAGHNEVERQSNEINKQVDNFKIPRTLTVINTRTDKIIVKIVGTFSIQKSDGKLNIICAIDENKYAKIFFNLNEWIFYIVEDCITDDIKLYKIDITYYPEC